MWLAYMLCDDPIYFRHYYMRGNGWKIPRWMMPVVKVRALFLVSRWIHSSKHLAFCASVDDMILGFADSEGLFSFLR